MASIVLENSEYPDPGGPAAAGLTSLSSTGETLTWNGEVWTKLTINEAGNLKNIASGNWNSNQQAVITGGGGLVVADMSGNLTGPGGSITGGGNGNGGGIPIPADNDPTGVVITTLGPATDIYLTADDGWVIVNSYLKANAGLSVTGPFAGHLGGATLGTTAIGAFVEADTALPIRIQTLDNAFGASGEISIKTGTSSTGFAGDITIQANGTAGGKVEAKADGTLALTGNTSILGNITTSNSSDFTLASPNSSAGPTNQVYFAAGNVTSTGVSGPGVALGGSTSTRGGDINITAGGGSGSGIRGGDVIINPGANGSGGIKGSIWLGGDVEIVLPTTPRLVQSGNMTLTLTSDTNLRFSVRGSDGVTRVANLTLA
jgi:hypothetical protein